MIPGQGQDVYRGHVVPGSGQSGFPPTPQGFQNNYGTQPIQSPTPLYPQQAPPLLGRSVTTQPTVLPTVPRPTPPMPIPQVPLSQQNRNVTYNPHDPRGASRAVRGGLQHDPRGASQQVRGDLQHDPRGARRDGRGPNNPYSARYN